VKLVCGIGNPGPEYDRTRHNVGWWVVDRVAADWRSGPFQRKGASLKAGAQHAGIAVDLLKPLTYVNRSGAALLDYLSQPDFDPAADLLVVVDDAMLDVGRLRLRPDGSAGGHNGLKSIEATLGSRTYARLRVGVGTPPLGVDLADWVLSSFGDDEEQQVLALLPDAVAAVGVWVEQGAESAMGRYNR
jgi:peptidyl-tRNA hydrolase, PTH1 family